MSVLKLPSSILCKCCRHVGRFSKIIEIRGLSDLRNRSTQLYVTHAHSAFAQYVTRTACSGVSSIATNEGYFKPRSIHRTFSSNLLLTGHLLHSPCGGTFLSSFIVAKRAYSISPQAQQKQEDPQTGEVGSKPWEATPTELHQDTAKPMSTKEEDDDVPKGLAARFKDAYKNYGKVLVVVHFATSAVWFSTFYYAAYAGIDVVPLLKWIGVSDRFTSPFQSSGVGNLAVAYLMYKLATPARYPVTIIGTRYTVKYMRATGLMPPVPEGSRIRDFVKESRVQVREKYEDLKDEVKDKMEEKRDELKDKMDEKRDELKEKIDEKREALKDKTDKIKDRLKNRTE